jgi:hypothetical protein
MLQLDEMEKKQKIISRYLFVGVKTCGGNITILGGQYRRYFHLGENGAY